MNKIVRQETDEKVVSNIYDEISSIFDSNKEKMVYQINNTLVNTYFLIGKVIVENEQNGNINAEYGKDVLKKLSKKLTDKFGKGFSRVNLQHMRLFYGQYKKCQTVSDKLSWSHYCYLIFIIVCFFILIQFEFIIVFFYNKFL